MSTLAPTLPTAKQSIADKNVTLDTKKSTVKRFKTPIKVNDCQVLAQPESVEEEASGDNIKVPLHQGLPVQGRRGSLLKQFIQFIFE